MSFMQGLVSLNREQITLVNLKDATEIRFSISDREIRFTIPIAPEIREFFLDIYECGNEVFSDWYEIYEIDKESKAELETLFREEISKLLKNFREKEFEIVAEVAVCSEKKLVFK